MTAAPRTRRMGPPIPAVDPEVGFGGKGIFSPAAREPTSAPFQFCAQLLSLFLAIFAQDTAGTRSTKETLLRMIRKIPAGGGPPDAGLASAIATAPVVSELWGILWPSRAAGAAAAATQSAVGQVFIGLVFQRMYGRAATGSIENTLDGIIHWGEGWRAELANSLVRPYMDYAQSRSSPWRGSRPPTALRAALHRSPDQVKALWRPSSVRLARTGPLSETKNFMTGGDPPWLLVCGVQLNSNIGPIPQGGKALSVEAEKSRLLAELSTRDSGAAFNDIGAQRDVLLQTITLQKKYVQDFLKMISQVVIFPFVVAFAGEWYEQLHIDRGEENSVGILRDEIVKIQLVERQFGIFTQCMREPVRVAGRGGAGVVEISGAPAFNPYSVRQFRPTLTMRVGEYHVAPVDAAGELAWLEAKYEAKVNLVIGSYFTRSPDQTIDLAACYRYMTTIVHHFENLTKTSTYSVGQPDFVGHTGAAGGPVPDPWTCLTDCNGKAILQPLERFLRNFPGAKEEAAAGLSRLWTQLGQVPAAMEAAVQESSSLANRLLQMATEDPGLRAQLLVKATTQNGLLISKSGRGGRSVLDLDPRIVANMRAMGKEVYHRLATNPTKGAGEPPFLPVPVRGDGLEGLEQGGWEDQGVFHGGKVAATVWKTFGDIGPCVAGNGRDAGGGAPAHRLLLHPLLETSRYFYLIPTVLLRPTKAAHRLGARAVQRAVQATMQNRMPEGYQATHANILIMDEWGNLFRFGFGYVLEPSPCRPTQGGGGKSTAKRASMRGGSGMAAVGAAGAGASVGTGAGAIAGGPAGAAALAGAAFGAVGAGMGLGLAALARRAGQAGRAATTGAWFPGRAAWTCSRGVGRLLGRIGLRLGQAHPSLRSRAIGLILMPEGGTQEDRQVRLMSASVGQAMQGLYLMPLGQWWIPPAPPGAVGPQTGNAQALKDFLRETIGKLTITNTAFFSLVWNNKDSLGPKGLYAVMAQELYGQSLELLYASLAGPGGQGIEGTRYNCASMIQEFMDRAAGRGEGGRGPRGPLTFQAGFGGCAPGVARPSYPVQDCRRMGRAEPLAGARWDWALGPVTGDGGQPVASTCKVPCLVDVGAIAGEVVLYKFPPIGAGAGAGAADAKGAVAMADAGGGRKRKKADTRKIRRRRNCPYKRTYRRKKRCRKKTRWRRRRAKITRKRKRKR